LLFLFAGKLERGRRVYAVVGTNATNADIISGGKSLKGVLRGD